MTTESDRCEHGTIRGYQPVMLYGDRWISVPSRDVPGIGIPHPLKNGDVLHALGLFGQSQAHALAWWAKATFAARGEELLTRIDVYEIEYELKARKVVPT